MSDALNSVQNGNSLEAVIEINDLRHNYGTVEVLKGINLTAYRGQVTGLLGVNGAGKTTAVRVLCGQLHPKHGSVKVLGHDPSTEGDKLRRLIGVMPENAGHYERLSAAENLCFFARIFGSDNPEARAAELLEMVSLDDKAKSRVSSLSKGMRQRLALARAMVGRPQLLFLDEPTSGLDPSAARQVRLLIDNYCIEGGTVFLTTHYLEEAEEMCAQIAILHQGRIVCCGNPQDLCRHYLPAEITVRRSGRLIKQAPGLEQLFRYFTSGDISNEP
ncbi:MAG: ABC transporter ATP-binding protein [Candidatus Bruticola sp.]